MNDGRRTNSKEPWNKRCEISQRWRRMWEGKRYFEITFAVSRWTRINFCFKKTRTYKIAIGTCLCCKIIALNTYHTRRFCLFFITHSQTNRGRVHIGNNAISAIFGLKFAPPLIVKKMYKLNAFSLLFRVILRLILLLKVVYHEIIYLTFFSSISSLCFFERWKNVWY